MIIRVKNYTAIVLAAASTDQSGQITVGGSRVTVSQSFSCCFLMAPGSLLNPPCELKKLLTRQQNKTGCGELS